MVNFSTQLRLNLLNLWEWLRVIQLSEVPQLQVEVPLCKILNHKPLLMCSWQIAWRPLPSVYSCVCELQAVCFERSTGMCVRAMSE